MRKLFVILLTLLVGLSFAQQDNADATLLQGLTNNEDFSTLVGLIDQAGLTADLEGAGPFTLFAPSNDVFAELNPGIIDQLNNDPELLKSVLQSHIVQGAYSIKDLSDAAEGSVMTLQGEPLVTDLGAGGLKVDGADLVSTDVDNTYANGVLHEVGDLVLPASLLSQLGISDVEQATGDVPATGVTFADLDTNGDGVLSQDEFDVGLFNNLDANADGVIDPTEFDANPGLLGGAFADFDADASGDLNDTEFRSAFDNNGLFTQLDSDGSGDISQEEFDANRDLLGVGAVGAVGTAVPAPGAAVGGAAETPGTLATFADLDTNGDGVLSQDEFDVGLFNNLDANADGVIDPTEFDANPGLLGGAFADFDADASGDLNDTEFRGAFADGNLFNQFDSDGSGDISQEEFDANRDLLGVGAGAVATPAAVQQAVPDTARVRVIHLSPNAPAVDISLTSTLEGGETFAPEELTGLSYEATTDYLDVPVGDYTVRVTSEGNPVFEEEVNFTPGISYTVAVIGLVLPGADAEAEQGGGFFGFIQDLFSGGSEPDTLSLRLLVLQDTLLSPVVEGDTLVRLVHAAPGTEAVDLTITNPEDATQRQNVIDAVAFGEASDYTSLTAGFSEPAVTIAGSEAVAFDLADTAFERGTVNTLFVTGTALEQAPLKVIALSDEPQLDPTVAVAAPTTGLAGATDPLQQAGGAETGGAETGGAETGGAETGGAETGGAETGGAETGGAETGGAETGGAETGGAQMFDGTVVEFLTEDGRFGTLLTAINDAGLAESLQEQAPFTLFAPTDDAFAALPDAERESILGDTEMLSNLLLYHVVPGKVMAETLIGDGQATTLEGSDITVTSEANGTVSLNDGQATVTEADIEASDGVVHVVSGVLLPASMVNP